MNRDQRRALPFAALLLSVLCSLFIALSFLVPVSAAASAVTPAVTVTPAIENLTLDQSQTSQTFTVQISNNTSSDLPFHLSAVDFKALNESGGVAFVGPSSGGLANAYGLASWIDLDSSDITVNAHQTAKVQVTVRNDNSLAPGGHYGAILLAAQSPDHAGTNQVSLRQTLSVPLFVIKNGGLRYDLKLNSVVVNTSHFHLPGQVTLRFYNPGNVQVVPRGIVSIVDPRGNTVAKGIINPDSGMILPQSYRRYDVTFQSVSRAWLIGRYKLVVQYRYDGYNQFASKNIDFYFWQTSWLEGSVILFVAIVVIILWRKSRKKQRTKNNTPRTKSKEQAERKKNLAADDAGMSVIPEEILDDEPKPVPRRKPTPKKKPATATKKKTAPATKNSSVSKKPTPPVKRKTKSTQ